jgi:hypothetical protein
MLKIKLVESPKGFSLAENLYDDLSHTVVLGEVPRDRYDFVAMLHEQGHAHYRDKPRSIMHGDPESIMNVLAMECRAWHFALQCIKRSEHAWVKDFALWCMTTYIVNLNISFVAIGPFTLELPLGYWDDMVGEFEIVQDWLARQ